MNTHDLAKTLHGLSLELRSLSSEASEAVASRLDLGQRRDATARRASKFAPANLTLLAIAEAVNEQTRNGTARTVQLRKDVFEKRVLKLSAEYTAKFERSCRTGAKAPEGIVVGSRFVDGPPGVKHYLDYLPGPFDHTLISAEFQAWGAAARNVIARLVPNYGRREIELYAGRRLDGDKDTAAWSLTDSIVAKRDSWADHNTFFRCKANAEGRIVAVHGVDPEPFAKLLNAPSGNALDPLEILRP